MILRCFLAWWILTFNTVSLQSKQYALPGQMVTFEPVITTPPDEILWKHNGNKVVEFNGNEETVYNPFEKRTTLDWHAAVLEIKQLRHDDSGKYELDVLTNKGLSRFYFELEVIDRVAKPSISCKMNNGSSGSDKSGNEATLMCSADSSESQSLMFEWSQHGKIHLGPILKILLGKEYDDEAYNCTVSNRLSKEMAKFTAKECYLVNTAAGLSDGVSATIGLIVVLCVLGALCIVYCKLKHKACFAKEKTKDVEQQSSLSETEGHTSKPLLDRLPTIPSNQRLRPSSVMSRNKNNIQNDEDTESDEDTETGSVKKRVRKFEQKQELTEKSENKLKKTQLPVAEKPTFNGNLAQNVKGETNADPHGEEPEKTVLAFDRLQDHSGATQHDLQAFTASELTDLEISKDVHKKRGPPVAIKPPFPVNLARNNKVTEIEPRQEPMEKKGLECGQLEERSGTTKPDLQTSTASEKPESEKEEDEEAPNMTPDDKHKGEKQDAIPDQVGGETKEETESDILREEDKSPTTDEQTESEKDEEEKKEAPNMATSGEHKEKKQDVITDHVTGETKEENAKKKEENDSDDLKEVEKSPTTDEQTGLENNKDKSKNTKPPVPKKSPFLKIIKDKADVNALRENKVSERDGLKEHGGATESDLQSSTASETPESGKKEDDEAPNTAPADKHKEEKQDAIPDQVGEETKEENENEKEENDSDDLREKKKSPTTDEQTGLENNKDKSKNTKPPVPKKSPFLKIIKDKADVNALRENKVSERDGLKEHGGATESDLQSSTASETPGLESNKGKSKKTKPPVLKRSPAFRIIKDKADVNALRENKVSERDGLKEHGGATESDLQSSTASETPESGKKEDEEAPNTAPADKHKEEKQDAITDQVGGETKEENENEKEENDSDDLREKKKATDEQTGLESNKDKSKKTKPPVPKKSLSFKKDKADVNALRENKVSERDGLKEHGGATESDLQSSTASETPGLESNKDKSKKPPPIVPKKLSAFRIKGQADVNALRENKVSERDGLKEHGGATESDLQSSTASETPESGKKEDEEAPNTAPADKHKEEKQDAITDQVGGETKEENENEKEENDSDDLREKKKSPTTDEQTELEKEADGKAKSDPKNDAGELVENSNSEQVPGETNEENVGK